MTWKTCILVVANVTADSDELLSALEARAQRSPSSFHLLIPANGVSAEALQRARDRLDRALAKARQRGLEMDGEVGHTDPIVAVSEAFDPRRYDEIIVSTLPVGASRWLQVDLPHRISRATGVPVAHVVGHEPRPQVASSTTSPRDQRPGVLTPLLPLTWARRGEPAGHDAPEARPAERPRR